MKLSSSATRLGVVACLLASSPAVALSISYCSKENTAASDTLRTSIYQSNGRCQTQCNADYAFAVVQDKSCWCTNYAPANQASVSSCDSPCPGYPDDLCGNAGKGLYGYIAMDNVQPSGTKGVPPTSTGSMATTQSTPQTETVTVTASDSVHTTLSTSLLSPGSVTSTTGGKSSTTTGPDVSIQTVAGQPVTVTVGNTGPTATSGSASTGNKSSSLSGGAIAGIVIGCLLGVGALAAAALWFFFFGRRRNEHEKSPSPDSRYDPSVPGTASDTTRQSRGSQMTFMRNFMGSGDPRSATSPNDYLSPTQAFTDNRMKKDATLYSHGSRHSAISLRDDEDYSRPVLRLTNPD